MGSITNGWDAICAFDVAQMNGVFLQQFLLQTQTTDALNVRTVIENPDGSGTLLFIDVLLGPPEVSFPSDLSTQQLQATMAIVSGNIFAFEPQGVGVGNLAWMIEVDAPPQSVIAGPVTLDQASGSDIVGSVVLNLSAGAYQVTLQGIAPGSQVSTVLGSALQAYFASAPAQYVVATVAQGNLPPGLTPTAFDMYLQPSPDTAGDGALLLLIKTNGSGGTVGPLASYPIPSGSDSVAIVSNSAIMNGAILPGLNTEVAGFGVTFSFDASSQTFATPEVADFRINVQNQIGNSSLCVAVNDPSPVAIPFYVTITFNDGQFNLSSSSEIFMCWYSNQDNTLYPMMFPLGWTASMTPSLDTTTGIVSFSSAGVPVVTYSQASLSLMVGQLLQSQLTTLLQNFTMPPIDTYVLSNLIFANPNAFVPASVSFPFDLLVYGNISQGLQLSPASTTLAVTEGATQSWSVSANGTPVDASDVIWAVSWGPGGIDANGVYTPSTFAEMPAMVVISATSKSDFSVTGSALLIVYQPQPEAAVSIDPPAVSLSDSGMYTFTASTDVKVSISPEVGTLTQTSGTSFAYTAPESVTDAQQVTITATSTSDPSQSGTAVVNLLISDYSIAIQYDSTPEPCPAGDYTLFGASSDVLQNFTWAITPPGYGRIVPTSPTGSTATYYAPSSVPTPVQVGIIAYGNDGSVFGVATQSLLVVPPT